MPNWRLIKETFVARLQLGLAYNARQDNKEVEKFTGVRIWN